MKLLFRNFLISIVIVLSFVCSPVLASTQQKHESSNLVSSSLSYFNSPIDTLIKDQVSGFLRVNTGLSFNRYGFAQLSTTVIITNDSNYVSINMQLQRYKGGKWTKVTSGTLKGKGLTGYSFNHYVSKGYKYRVKSILKLYKSKNGKLLKTDTCYSKTIKH